MNVFVYSAHGDNEEIQVFSSLEKAIKYAKSKYDSANAEFKQHKYDKNRWSYTDSEDPIDILKLEIDNESTEKDHKVAFARTYSLAEPIIIGWFAKPHADGTFNIKLLQRWLYDEINHGPVGPVPENPSEFTLGVPLPLDYYENMPKTPAKWKDKVKVKFGCNLEIPLTKFGLDKNWAFKMDEFFDVTGKEFDAILAECYEDGFEGFDDESFCK